MSALLQVEGLEVTYAGSGGTVHAVRGVDLTVAPGEVVAVVSDDPDDLAGPLPGFGHDEIAAIADFIERLAGLR